MGEPDRVRFVADLPDYLGRGGPYLHDVSVLGDGPRALAVAFTQVQNSREIAEDAPRKPEPLASDLAEVRFRYRALDQTGVLGDWQDRWTAVDHLPLQVSIAVKPVDGPAWPEIVVALPSASGTPASAGAVP
jgi:general secretion pathway protein J